jgi:hypothetical protein
MRRPALVIEILLAYGAARRALRRPLPEAVAALRAVPATQRSHLGVSPAEGRRLGAAVMRVLRLLPVDDRCLVRSLTLVRLLSRRGLPATVVIGVRTDPEFAAHAWVEMEGAPVIPDGAGEFTRLMEVPDGQGREAASASR